ncbi:OmpL47-type beta-barrel domain-containing protein [Cellulomonas fengjieae]|uniref:non-reducing end alpha-L-arabinofuranosidase n=1 Tax=Cellulomonas fengjieae TaxID=2819978 RepID=A0ABS3SC48_9CELL|nr:alpha-L-arabinofuranosidase C-terminal domain-containing protein [Cellulomonas fengjieae]MBO3083325.1 carbohydrate binding domain-containing protein [Cellulomonas fengjieae]QVI65327.1 carbohydrate binding domain-containing protein [Cellulomonas fengjieae]
MGVAAQQVSRRSRPVRRALTAALTAALVVPIGIVVATPAGAAPPVPDGAWTDGFDSATLGPRWNVLNDEPSARSLTATPGALTLTALPGDTWQGNNSARNVMTLDIPDGDFSIAVTVQAPVERVFQGAGLIAYQDLDNYVRSGLTFVGDLSPSGVAIETDIETAAIFAADDFEDRPGSTEETLRLTRAGDTVTTARWDEPTTTWVDVNAVEVTFPIEHLGLYALAAQDGTTFPAVFDDVTLVASPGQDVIPDGPFTLRAPGTAPHLTTGADDAIVVAEQRPGDAFVLEATEVTGGITLTAGDRPVAVLPDGRLALGDEPTVLRLTDAGGGRLHLTTADASQAVGIVDGGLLLGDPDDAAGFVLEPFAVGEGTTIAIDGDGTDAEISDRLYGIFYEDINYAADGGLYAELVRNRSFEFNASDNASFTGLTAWDVLDRSGAGTTVGVVDDDGRLNATNRNRAVLVAAAAGDGLRNASYNTGVAVRDGESYDASVWVRTTTAQTLTLAVEGADGSPIASGTVDVDGSDAWRKYEATLTASATTDAGRFVVLAGAPSTLHLDQVSLFPQDTWVGPVNGKSPLRRDLAEKIAALDPSFLRFPGGCVTNVGTFRTYEESGYTDRRRAYQWKETIGPVEERATNWNFWGYNQSYGIGYLEYMELAEDLDAIPLPVLSVGANGCGSTIPEMTDPAQIDRWVQDTLDLIEFATGDVSTTWGAERAELGHPEPFELPYIGLGNEENTTTFEANFPQFRDAIVAAYPDIEIISNSGPDDTGARFDALWEFNREQEVDLVDEHYYNDPSWFLTNTERYDSYDREGPHVFLGEYASRGNTWWNGLTEAAFMTGLERNGDLVELASYAPLLANESYVQWSPDAIWFDNDESWASANYWVQHLFSNQVGDQVVPSTLTTPSVEPQPLDGGVFLSTWNTAAAYDNVRVTSNDGGDVLFQDDFADASAWSPQTGDWSVVDGEYVQSSTTTTDARSIPAGAYEQDWSSYTLELDARKSAGSEGFLVGFAAGGPNDYFWWNLGGWNNTRQALQKADGGGAGEVEAVEGHSIATDQTYRVKVVVEGRHIELYLDGVLQMSYDDPAPAADVFQVVTRDEDSGDLVAKMVNVSAVTQRTQIEVSDADVAPTGSVTEIVAPPGATNTKSAPSTVEPVTREVDGLSPSFGYDLPPYSVTFLTMHTVPADSTAPTVDSLLVSPDPVGDWRAAPATVVATASDDRAVATLETSVDGGAWTASADPATVSVQVEGHGEHIVAVRATDAAGNVSDERSVTFALDAVAPTTSASVDAQRRVTLTGADEGSGVERIEYRLGTGPWTVYADPVQVGASATTVEHRAVDRVGNVGPTTSTAVPAASAVRSTTSVRIEPWLVRRSMQATVVATVRAATGPAPTGEVTATVRPLRLHGDAPVVAHVTRDLTPGASRSSSATLQLPRLPIGLYAVDTRYAGSATVQGSDTWRLLVVLP